jgi:hypothetical protein
MATRSRVPKYWWNCRVKTIPRTSRSIIGQTAQLKIVEVKNEGPWKTKEEALAAKGGILPLDTELSNGFGREAAVAGTW